MNPPAAFRGNQGVGHRTIRDFRALHLSALSDLFVQVVRLAREMGRVKLSTVAIDDTKLQANANRHKAMSYERMQRSEGQLKAQIDALLARAKTTDEAVVFSGPASGMAGGRGGDLAGENDHSAATEVTTGQFAKRARSRAAGMNQSPQSPDTETGRFMNARRASLNWSFGIAMQAQP